VVTGLPLPEARPVKTAPLAPALLAVPAAVPRPPVPLLDWPAARPSFLAWLDYAHGSALTSWVRHRFGRVTADCAWEPPVPHVVYLIRAAATPPAFYVGITRADRFAQRMAEHQRASRRRTEIRVDDWTPADSHLRAYRLDAWEAFEMVHGFDRVEHTIAVPDMACALLAESLWTCLIAGAGYKVFGHDTYDICPAKAWFERRPWWDRNTVRPAVHPSPART
jgi:hypothetical protein